MVRQSEIYIERSEKLQNSKKNFLQENYFAKDARDSHDSISISSVFNFSIRYTNARRVFLEVNKYFSSKNVSFKNSKA